MHGRCALPFSVKSDKQGSYAALEYKAGPDILEAIFSQNVQITL